MSHHGAQPGSVASGTVLGSPASTEKYPASSSQENYPELAVQMNQPPLHAAYQPPPNQSPFTPQTPYQYQSPSPQQVYEPQAQQKRNPWGLSPLAFGVIVALITALVVGGAVGGGVAGAMSGNDNSSSEVAFQTVTVTADGAAATGSGSSTATETGSATTSSGLPEPSSLRQFTVPEPYYIATLEDPGCQKSRIDVQYDEKYDLKCGIDMGNGRADSDDSSKIVADIVGIFAYSITDCLYACANVNHFTEYYKQDVAGGVMQKCKGISWNYNMASSNESNHANCWLKNGTSSGYQCNSCISGTLVT